MLATLTERNPEAPVFAPIGAVVESAALGEASISSTAWMSKEARESERGMIMKVGNDVVAGPPVLPTLPAKAYAFYAGEEENGDVVMFVRLRKRTTAHWPPERLELSRACMGAIQTLVEEHNSEKAVDAALAVLAEAAAKLEFDDVEATAETPPA